MTDMVSGWWPQNDQSYWEPQMGPQILGNLGGVQSICALDQADMESFPLIPKKTFKKKTKFEQITNKQWNTPDNVFSKLSAIEELDENAEDHEDA